VSPILSARGGLSSRAYGQFTAAAGALTAYESIATVTVGSGGQSSIEFTSIPSTYTHLQIRALAKNDGLASISIRFNGDSGSNYSWHRLYGNGTSAISGGSANAQPQILGGVLDVQFGSTIIDILDYVNTSKYKTTRSLSGFDNNGSGWVGLWSGNWMNTAAISSITITSGTISQYSQFALYGIKGA